MQPRLSELTRVFARIGLMSFGGPVAQIGVMHRELVETRPWLSDPGFTKALSFCMLLPGPEAMQLCTYAGWRLRGVAGGLIAGALFVLPGALVMAALAYAYLRWGALPGVAPAFLGIKAAVIVVVLQALIRIAGKALRRPLHYVLAPAAFLAIFALSLPFPLVIGAAALAGSLGAQSQPTARPDTPRARLSLATATTWLALWWAPIAALWALGATRLAEIGLFFSKLAVVSFGGAYAVLAYVTDEAVATKGWLSTAQMVDGLGLAETTPGPLILVTEYVGYLAGHGAGGTALALAAAAVTLWATFIPCFLWIFTLAPLLDRLTGAPRLAAALEAVTAAVVGVIASLALIFALNTLFTAMHGPKLPDWTSISTPALALTVLAAFLLIRLRLSLPLTLGIMALAGAGFGFVG